MNISFEIVPRSWPAFWQQYEFVQSLGGAINVINAPDIQRLPIRSWEINEHVDASRYRFIPHFRAIDYKIDDGRLFTIIEQQQLERILLVSGDPPEGLKRSFYNTSVVDLIRAVHRVFPALKIYAGFDPHRTGLQQECEYVQRKIEAGASGFFSQPFYDERMIEIYLEQLPGLDVYVGLSPITSKNSQNYWEVKNKVRFPAEFRPDNAWNVEFANRVLANAAAKGYNVYFMPIKVDLDGYFQQLRFPRLHGETVHTSY